MAPAQETHYYYFVHYLLWQLRSVPPTPCPAQGRGWQTWRPTICYLLFL